MYKNWIAFRMCLSMFTALPLPQAPWDEELRRRSVACLPLAGLVIGLIWWAIAALGRALLPQYLAAALMAALPMLITGFIHLDGFMDTSDAMLSWRSREDRIKILKDVHVGSFSVVMLVLLAMFQFAACMSVERLFPLCMIPVLSRTGSAYSVLKIAPLGHSEYAASAEDQDGLARSAVFAAAGALLLLLIFSGFGALLCGCAALLGYAAAMRWCVKTLGGVSGDLAGFALTISELCALLALALI